MSFLHTRFQVPISSPLFLHGPPEKTKGSGSLEVTTQVSSPSQVQTLKGVFRASMQVFQHFAYAKFCRLACLLFSSGCLWGGCIYREVGVGGVWSHSKTDPIYSYTAEKVTQKPPRFDCLLARRLAHPAHCTAPSRNMTNSDTEGPLSGRCGFAIIL